ncbi:MAG: hypothetical protein ABJM36_06075 [Algibacter sp.]|uniref:hypothetical protein n=1 Tax=Algibacter sp. TaxID=1872428 RepID=UPI00329A0A25
MKPFLLYILKITIAVIVLMYALDALYSYTFVNNYPRNKVHKILQLKNKHYDIAFLGSSRTENHIDCELVKKITGKSCVNLGISGASLGDMLVLLSLAESNKITFDSLVIQIDYNFYHSGLSNTFKANLVPFIKNSVIKRVLNNDKDNFYYNYIPFYRYMKYDKVLGFREFLATFLNKKPKKEVAYGFNPKHGVGLEVSGKLPDAFSNTNADLESIKTLVNRVDSKLFLFTAPHCNKIINRNKLQELNTVLPTLYNYVSLFDNKEEYFFNCAHLNIEGAREFTEVLIHDMFPSSNR